jgi:hypothetical protein
MSAHEELPLPELQESLLDEETLERLLRDIQEFTIVDEVLLKGGPLAMTSGPSLPLPEAVALLRQGRVLGVQVRYRHEGSRWWDTLLRAPQGVRLIRIEHPLAPGAAQPRCAG